MAEATFRHGDPVMVDYTPASGNIAAGQVVLLGSVTANTAGTGAVALIAHEAITNNVKGAMAAGGGVYAVTNLNNAANGAFTYWDDSNNGATSTSTNNAKLGPIIGSGGGGTNSTCYVLHRPE